MLAFGIALAYESFFAPPVVPMPAIH